VDRYVRAILESANSTGFWKVIFTEVLDDLATICGSNAVDDF
jgi:hypothetical protein